MLRSLLRTIFAPAQRRQRDERMRELPERAVAELDSLHARTFTERHLEALYGGLNVEGLDFLKLYRDCLARTDTRVRPWKALLRPASALNLARYFASTLRLPGARAECGVLCGFSALLMCRVAAARLGAYPGGDFHLVDSFAGFSQPQEQDLIDVSVGASGHDRRAIVSGGSAVVPIAAIRDALHEFPEVHLHEGFIPDVFASLPETRWAFVHIDVDLYTPTLASLAYFHDRMLPAGVIVCDDYGSALFPGARKAWEGYCGKHDIPYAVLPTGQAVILC